jgi:hypothetical protein
VPPQRRLAGDLFYLTVKTLDAGERGITCCTNGFYINDSVEKSHFNPLPTQRKSASGQSLGAFSYTLVGCLRQISPAFSKNLEIYLNQVIKTEPYFLMKPAQKIHHWANFEEPKSSEVGSQEELSEVITPLYGLDPKGIRDWNEEF